MADRLQEVLEESGELEWWMAQALDGELGPEAQGRFEGVLAEQPAAGQLWLCWQELETLLATTPALEPATGFVRRFEQRLAEQERQAHQRVCLRLVAAGLGWLGWLLQGSSFWCTHSRPGWQSRCARCWWPTTRFGCGGRPVPRQQRCWPWLPSCSGWAGCRLPPPVFCWPAGCGCSGTAQERTACLSPCR